MYNSNEHFLDREQDQNIKIQFNCQDGVALQLVRINDSKFELVEETVNYLKSIEGGVAICSIVGKYRTGKSFLINKILQLEKDKGFIVSPSVDACTKGLWIWSKPIYNDREDLNIFFMDTEGLDSVDQNSTIDSKLFTLSILLSSYFIYNSVGAIEENSISNLGLITKLIKTITIEENTKIESSYNLSQYAPKFLWVLRDFMLEIKDMSGNIVTPKMYLDSILSDMPIGQTGYTRTNQKSIEIRETILNFFKTRDCITIVRPVHDENELRNIQYLDDTRIRPEFLNKLHLIRDKIYRECSQKTINGTPLNMSMFLIFMSQFINSFNNGKMPAIQTAWENLMENECFETYEKALELYNLEITQFREENHSYNKLELFKYFNQLRDYTLNYYSRCSFVGDRDLDLYNKYLINLKTQLDNDQEKTIEFFYNQANQENSGILNNLFNNYDFNRLEKLTPKRIVKDLRKNVFSLYEETNLGGENLLTLEKNIENLTLNFFNNFSETLNGIKVKKEKNAQRQIQIDKDKLSLEMENLKNKENLLEKIKFDIENLETKKINLKEIDDSGLNELFGENENLQNLLKKLLQEEKTNEETLEKIKIENDKMLEKKKKKKFFGIC